MKIRIELDEELKEDEVLIRMKSRKFRKRLCRR